MRRRLVEEWVMFFSILKWFTLATVTKKKDNVTLRRKCKREHVEVADQVGIGSVTRSWQYRSNPQIK